MLQLLGPSRARHWTLIALVFFPVLACTLPAMHFTDSMESFNVLTAMETARDGNWLTPTLWSRPRLEKPPLAHWMTALGILTGGKLEFAARWPTLLLATFTLVVVYEWGRLVGGIKRGLAAAVILGTTIALLRFGRRAHYDSQLMFWVALANYGFTYLVLHGRRWPAILFGGLGLGGALLTKGPPALLHTVVPVLAFAVVADVRGRRIDLLGRCAVVVPLALATGIAATIPWVLGAIDAAGGVQAAVRLWTEQLTRESELSAGLRTTPLDGFVFLALLVPWTIWFFGAFLQTWRDRERSGLVLPFLLTLSVLPVAIHACIPPVRDRYLLPMAAPAAIACAIVLCDWIERMRSGETTRLDRLAYHIHLLILLGFVAGYPLYFAFSAEDRIPPLAAALLAGIGTIVVGIGWQLTRKMPWAVALITVPAMLQSQVVYTWHQNRDVRQVESAGRQIAADPSIGRIAAYENNVPPRAFALYSGKPFTLVSTADRIPPGAALLTEQQPPAGWDRVTEFHDGRHLWVLWQMPEQAVNIRASHGK